jgi:hypothetical protein
MSTNETTKPGGVAQAAPTEQQAAKSAPPKRFEKGQTVCNEKDAKGKLHNGHLKQVSPVREDARQHMRGDDLLYRCQTCGTLYMGPPLGHVRDPGKQARYVQSELVTILEAAGGTLPAFKRNEAGAWVLANDTQPHAPVAAAAQNIKPAAPTPKPTPAAAATPAATDAAAPSDETPEQKRARIIAEAKAKAAARMAGGATAKSETPAASPTPAPAVAATVAPDGETPEQKRERLMAEVKAKAAARMAAKGGGAASTPTPPATTTTTPKSSDAASTATPPAAPASATPAPASPAAVPADETPEQRRERQMAEIKAKAAARMAAKNNPGGAQTGGETSIATPPLTAQPPSPTSGTDSSPAADAHRPAAEAQAATGQASAAPLSPAAATASPAAGAETPADLAPDASTELTPGAPGDERDDESTTE